MQYIIWQAEVTKEAWEKLTEEALDQICDDLEIFFDQLREYHLDKGEHQWAS